MPQVTKERHPQLWLCMKAIREDNDLPFEEWGGIKGYDEIRIPHSYSDEEIDGFEKLLKPLSLEEIQIFNTAELTDQIVIREKYGLRVVNGFLEEYFENWCLNKGENQTPEHPNKVEWEIVPDPYIHRKTKLKLVRTTNGVVCDLGYDDNPDFLRHIADVMGCKEFHDIKESKDCSLPVEKIKVGKPSPHDNYVPLSARFAL